MHNVILDTRLPQTPRFSAVIATYNVEPYLPAFLASLSRQSIEQSEVEYIFVNDASTDASLDAVLAWAFDRPNVVVTSFDKNCGVSCARNLGYDLARGMWVTSLDPDDMLDHHYFTEVKRFELAHGTECDLLSSRVATYDESLGIAQFNHPLDFRFSGGDHVLDLEQEPRLIQLGATTFLRKETLRAADLHFDPNVKPTFEDAHLIGKYLLNVAAERPHSGPRIGVIADALYFYRHRQSQNSLVSSAWNCEAKYYDEIRFGYLDLLDCSAAQLKRIPRWLENVMIYQLSWQFIEGTKPRGANSWIVHKPQLRDAYLQLVDRVMSYLSLQSIYDFSIKELPAELRAALLARYFGDDTHGFGIVRGNNQELFVPAVNVSESSERTDHSPTISERLYRVLGVPFARVISSQHYSLHELAQMYGIEYQEVSAPTSNAHGLVTPPPTATNLIERLSGTADGLQGLTTSVLLNSKLFALPRDSRLPSPIVPLAQKVLRKAPTLARRAGLNMAARATRLPYLAARAQRTYAHAWLIMDRMSGANDNAEHFYRYLHNQGMPENAYFMISPTAPDYHRLKRAGFRMLPNNPIDVISALQQADVIIASDWAADDLAYIWNLRNNLSNVPLVFLQHGVTKDDISQWLNGLGLSMIVTSIPEERDYLLSPSSSYDFTPEQVILTGMPRYDRLRELRQARRHLAADAHAPRVMTVMPTWRNSLRDDIQYLTGESRILRFRQSDYFSSWNELLRGLSAWRERTNTDLHINFVTHPNVSEFLKEFNVGSELTYCDIRTTDLQKLLVDSDIFLTDYSSTAFDAAIAGAKVAYFHFDRESFFNEQQNMAPGWFDYERDGFGPVLSSAADVIDWLKTDLHHEIQGGNDDIRDDIDDIYAARRTRMVQSIPVDSCAKIYSEIKRRFSP